jgi:hypothetical protein
MILRKPERPPPLYPRTLLSWLVYSVIIATLCVLGLSIVVLILARAVGNLADQRQADRKAATHQSNAEVREIDRLRQQVKDLGGNPGPVKFHSTRAHPASSSSSAPVPTPALSPRPASHPPTARPSAHPTSKPTRSPTSKPTHTPTPHPVASCLRHPLRCLPVSRTTAFEQSSALPMRSDSVRRFLRHREPAEDGIDVLRAVVVMFGACYTGWVIGRWRRLDATCREGKVMRIALLLLWTPIWLTEAKEIGLEWLPWRLPLALAAIPATVAVEWIHRELHHPEVPSVSHRIAQFTGRTLRRSAD